MVHSLLAADAARPRGAAEGATKPRDKWLREGMEGGWSTRLGVWGGGRRRRGHGTPWAPGPIDLPTHRRSVVDGGDAERDNQTISPASPRAQGLPGLPTRRSPIFLSWAIGGHRPIG
eukprot:9481876-Pyramimonas_sp.AAC.1